MNVTTIAITGASGLVGQCLIPELAARGGRLVALDVREPRRRAPNLEFHRVDIARGELKPLLEATDVLVHLAAVVDPIPDEALMAHVNVEGTRRVLDAAGAVGVRKIIRVSSAAVYGAWANNARPLGEDAPLRPNQGFSPAVQAAETERLLAEWHADHPTVTVTTLRTAPVLGPGAERLPSRLLLRSPPLRIRGADPPVQVVHVDDLVAALVLAVESDLGGVYNVSADVWLEPEVYRALVGRSSVPPLPAELVERVLERTWAWGIGDIPPGVVPYLMHPWVLDNQRLRAAGWTPRHTNEEALREGLATMPPSSFGRWLATLCAGAVTGAALTMLLRRRFCRTRKRP